MPAIRLPVYMDSHATTPVDPRVVRAMLPYFTETFGNAGSVNHSYGASAAEAVDAARHTIAQSIGARDKEIVFTSGATESNNMALRGIADRAARRGNHLVSVATEHNAVLDPLARLGRRGCNVSLLDVRQVDAIDAGRIDAEQVAAAVSDETILVSVMLANNEIGVLQPIAEIAAVCRARGVLLHCDATQGVGRIPVDVRQLGVDLMSFSAHKLYGPKGIGALYIRSGPPSVRLEPLISGGGQERGLRGGTLNVPGIVGFAEALRICREEMDQEARRIAGLRRRLFDRLDQSVEGVALNGPSLDRPDLRLPGNLNLRFAGIDAEALLLSCSDVALSSGSACTSANPEPSHVLLALGLSDESARSSVRFGMGRFNTEAEIDFVADALADGVKRLRRMSGVS